ncbi:MAG: hypothetical protein SGJ11_03935 [Phycisphaerae bacterium]|nr:hypothetical protein [Phycisphaerae bacterium]
MTVLRALTAPHCVVLSVIFALTGPVLATTLAGGTTTSMHATWTRA